MGDRYQVVEALGLAVLPAPMLKTKVVIVKGQDIALVNPDLPDQDHEWISDWLLEHALRLAQSHLQ